MENISISSLLALLSVVQGFLVSVVAALLFNLHLHEEVPRGDLLSTVVDQAAGREDFLPEKIWILG